MKLYVEIRQTKDGKRTYPCLCADIGYAIRVLSYDSFLCVELSKLTAEDLLSRPVGAVIPIKI